MLIEPVVDRKQVQDRFILPRSTNMASNSGFQLGSAVLIQDKAETYEKYIAKELFEPNHQYREQMKYFSTPDNQNSLHNDILSMMANRKKGQSFQKETQRVFNTGPQKILDAPDLKDDYYLNLLDWSSKGVLSIGLADRVYLYTQEKISELCQKETDYICSLAFHPEGNTLAVGLSNGKTELYDIERQAIVRTLKGHSGRVSSSAFTYGSLFTGSRDSTILGHDPRAQHHLSMKLQGHRGQVCGLKHDACGLASGSNDNTAVIWDLNMAKQRFLLQGHKAAVKALAWCPWQRNLLVTGGGSSDKTMRFWNIQTGKTINVVNTESQVCSLIWNKNQKELLSSHGYSQNQLCVWKYPQCTKLAELYGHTQRVLHMTLSPDNSTVCTASADQTLRFWQVFNVQDSSVSDDKLNGKLSTKYCTLR